MVGFVCEHQQTKLVTEALAAQGRIGPFTTWVPLAPTKPDQQLRASAPRPISASKEVKTIFSWTESSDPSID